MITLIILLISTSCSSNDPSGGEKVDFASNASKVFVDDEFEKIMEFDLLLFSAKKIKTVGFVGFEGQDIDAADNFAVTIEDVTVDEIAQHKYKDLYTKIIRVHIDADEYDGDISIERIALNVDGVTRQLDFSTPLRHTFKGENHFTEPMQISVIPIDFSSSYINNAGAAAVYRFEATEDLTLNNIRFNNFLTADNVLYSINGSKSSELKYPLKVKKGQLLELSISFSSDTADSISTVLTGMYFDYVSDADGQELYNRISVSFDPVFPITDHDLSALDRLIDSVLGQ